MSISKTTIDNRKTIRELKKRLKNISVVRVADKAKMSRSSLYYHLDEANAANMNLQEVKKITDAIKIVEAEKAKAIKEISQFINT